MDIVINIINSPKIWEFIAVSFGLGYIVLAIKENIWCWLCAAISTTIYIVLFRHVSLLMDSALNAYYLIMAGVGFFQWKKPTPISIIDQDVEKHKHLQSNQLKSNIIQLPFQYHISIIIFIIGISFIAGNLLDQFTQAAWPYLDSFTTIASLITTIMVVKKILENWLYWIVIDTISIFIYLERELFFTAALFIIYTILAVIGYLRWKNDLNMNTRFD